MIVLIWRLFMVWYKVMFILLVMMLIFKGFNIFIIEKLFDEEGFFLYNVLLLLVVSLVFCLIRIFFLRCGCLSFIFGLMISFFIVIDCFLLFKVFEYVFFVLLISLFKIFRKCFLFWLIDEYKEFELLVLLGDEL